MRVVCETRQSVWLTGIDILHVCECFLENLLESFVFVPPDCVRLRLFLNYHALIQTDLCATSLFLLANLFIHLHVEVLICRMLKRPDIVFNDGQVFASTQIFVHSGEFLGLFRVTHHLHLLLFAAIHSSPSLELLLSLLCIVPLVLVHVTDEIAAICFPSRLIWLKSTHQLLS